MKIYLLSVASAFQPEHQPFVYPRHNDDYYCIEQDFLAYLHRHPELVATSPDDADWFYLPIFWTRWHLLHDYATSGLPELQREVDQVVSDVARTFTVCQYDGGPQVDTGIVVCMGAGRMAHDIEIPMLCKHHTPVQVGKRYLASFSGRMDTHPLRREMAHAVSHRPDVLMRCGDLDENAFVRMLMESYVALCPRGSSGCSFRFYEAMQLGVVPLMIGEDDTRPFKRFINWDICSLYARSVEDIEGILDHATGLDDMGRQAREVFCNHLDYQQWCPHVLQELEERA